ncbi:10317_t:CDS:1, partial [Racocetra fulgida]
NSNQESSIQIIQNEDKLPLIETFHILERICGQEVTNNVSGESESKKASYSRGLGLCKKALNIAITNGSSLILEDLLQRFINKQAKSKNI